MQLEIRNYTERTRIAVFSTPAKNAPHAQNIFFAKHMIVMVVNAFGARGFSRLNVNYDELHESRKYGIQN
jgi:hypothetical protein